MPPVHQRVAPRRVLLVALRAALREMSVNVAEVRFCLTTNVGHHGKFRTGGLSSASSPEPPADFAIYHRQQENVDGQRPGTTRTCLQDLGG